MLWHNSRVLKTLLGFSHKADKWDACDEQLKSFAHMAAVSVVGCGACLDFGYFQIHNKQLDVDKAREVPRWRESERFTPLERDVLEYAEAMSQTPLAVTDELSERLLGQLGAPGLIELTAFVAAANMVSRNNVTLGIRADRVSSSCGYAVPLMDLVGQRDTLLDWASRRGPEGIEEYWGEKNAVSIDGLPAVKP